MKWMLALAIAGMAGAIAIAPPANTREAHACGDAGPFDFDTHERFDYATDYAAMIELVAQGTAIPSVFNVNGEEVDLTYPGLESGPRGDRTGRSTAYRVPPTLYKSIVWIESNWANGAGTVPYGGVGPILRSFDCGYGLGQITSGMGNYSGSPLARQAAIGTHPLFNVAEGIRIVASKWNSAPEARPIAGAGDPAALEDWFYAVWSYQGFWFGNHPYYPLLDPLRGGDENSPLYHCYEPKAYSWQNGTYGYGDYTYPERVYGCMKYPPRIYDSLPLSVASEAAKNAFAPGEEVIVSGVGSCLRIRSAPSLAGVELGCLPDGTRLTVVGGPVTADGYDWWEVSGQGIQGWAVDDYLAPAGAEPAPTPSPSPEPTPGPPRPPKPPPVLEGRRLWAPVNFVMPELTYPAVARAFNPANFSACEDRNFSGGCPEMDFPTTIPEWDIMTHTDPTPPVDPTVVARFLGAPSLTVSGPTDVILGVAPGADVGSVGIEVRNLGQGVGPFRIRVSHPWILVRHEGDPPLRTLDGGVAIGTDVGVVVRKDPLLTQAGYVSSLRITVDKDQVPPGRTTGSVVIEPLLGQQAPFVITVTADTGASPPPPPRRFQVGLPTLGRD